MQSYETSTPRAVLGLAATAMAALALGILVVLPASLQATRGDGDAFASAKAAPAGPVEVAIHPARIDVIVMREPNVAWALTDEKGPNCRPQG